LRAAEEAAARLVHECRKGGRLYRGAPRAAAQASRTAKWLLNAVADLRRALEAPDYNERGDQGDQRGA
jgi:hypothetical protein